MTIDTSGTGTLMTIAGKMAPDLSPAATDRIWLKMTRDVHTATPPAFGMILVRDRLDIASAISAGRAWQRLHLTLTAQGLAAQPLRYDLIYRPAKPGERLDVVLGQMPRRGTLSAYDNVTLILAKPRFGIVPNVVGMSESEARSTLTRAGFNVARNVEKEYSDSVQKGRISSQSIGAGARVSKGSIITLKVSDGPEPDPCDKWNGRGKAPRGCEDDRDRGKDRDRDERDRDRDRPGRDRDRPGRGD